MAQHAEVSARWDSGLSSSPHSRPVQPGEASWSGTRGRPDPWIQESLGTSLFTWVSCPPN